MGRRTTDCRGPNGWFGPMACAIAATLCIIPSFVHAESTNAERLLKEAWGGRAEHRERADGIHFEDRNSNETSYAYALVLIRQNRFNKAQTVLDNLLERSPDHSDAREARLWMKVAQKQYHDAIPDLARWVESFAKAPDRLVRVATAGRLMGFIDVSLKSADADLVLLSGGEKIRMALKGADWDLFTRQRQGVQNRFAALIDLRNKTVAEVDAEFAKNKRVQQGELSADRDTMRARIQELQEQRAKVREEIDRQLAELQSAEQPLRQQLSSLNAVAAPISRHLASIESHIYYIEHRLYHEEDPSARSWLHSELRRLEWLARDYDRDLFQLDIQATAIQNDRARLHSDANLQLASQQQDLSDTNQEGNRVQKDIKRVETLEKKLRRAKGPGAKQGWRLSLRARTLGTYYNFSIELKRSELLDQLAARSKPGE